MVKGKVDDMAVGEVIGTAFGKIITSVVNDVIMPGAGFFVSRVDQLIIEIDLLSQELVELIACDSWRKDKAHDDEDKPKRRLKAA